MQIPQYKLVSDSLKSQIHSGFYSEGDLLPSENTLALTHNITRTTVRKSLNELEKDGYISKLQGKGSIVIQKRKKLGLLSFKGFSSTVRHSKFSTTTKIIQKPQLSLWPKNFFYILNKFETDHNCIYLSRVRFVEDTAVMYEQTYIPNINLSHFCNRNFVNDSLFETLLLHYKIEIINVEQDIKAICANTEQAAYLNIEENSPIIHIYRRYSTNKDGFNFYSSLYCNTNNYSIGNIFI